MKKIPKKKKYQKKKKLIIFIKKNEGIKKKLKLQIILNQ